MRKSSIVTVAALGGLAVSIASAQPLEDAKRTVFLQAAGTNWGQPMNVAWNPVNEVYYGGGGGFTPNDATVWDANGVELQFGDTVIDLRSWYWNSNINGLEAVSYDAQNGGRAQDAIWELEIDGDGLLTGGSTELLPNAPGLFDSQTMPAYSSSENVWYSSTNGGSNVNVVDRADGSLIRSFGLDMSGRTNSSYGIGYDEDEGWVLIIDAVSDQVHAFDTDGNFIGSSNLDFDYTNLYGFGYANKQVFAWDAGRAGWQGYDIGAGGGGNIRLSLAGDCPGTVTATASNATPGNRVYFIYGFAEGDGPFVPGCPDLRVDVLNPQIAGSDIADANGEASVSGNVPPAGCGRVFVQAVDNTACVVSNVEGI